MLGRPTVRTLGWSGDRRGIATLACVDDDFWPEDEVDGAAAPPPGRGPASLPALPAGTRPAAPLFPHPTDPRPADGEPQAATGPPIYAPPAGDGVTARAGVPV